MGVRGKLIALMVLALIPFLALQAFQIIARYEQRIDAHLQASQDLAKAISAAFVNCLDTIWSMELALGNAVLQWDGPVDPRKVEALLYAQLRAHSTLRALSWIDPEGVVVASTDSKGTGRRTPDSESLRLINLGQDLVVSNLTKPPGQQALTFTVSRGIRRDGLLVGVIAAAVDAKKLGQVLPAAPASPTASFGLVDQNALIVFHNLDPEMPITKRSLPAWSPVYRVLRGEAVTFRNTRSELTPEPRAGASVPIGLIGWAAFATEDLDKLIAPLKAEAAREVTVLALVCFLSLLATSLLGNSLLRPIQALRQAAQNISGGNLSARVGLTGQDELATTGETFDRMAERIQELEATRTRFMQIAAHELRNPMTPVKGFLSLLRRRIAEGRPLEEQDKVIEVMEKEVDRLSTLLNEILEAFRVREGRLPLNLEKIDLAVVLESAIQPYLASQGQHRFTLDRSDRSAIWILGDFKRLRDVFDNLLSNAVKYSPDGGEIRVTLKTAGHQAGISISDSGVGIPKDQLTKVFDGFYRANNLTGRDPGGLGLGLFICRDVIQRHGGRIWAESTAGPGTTIYVELPMDGL